MDKTDKQAVYDIATKLGYTGDEGPSVASAIYAVAQARGYEGACEGDASQALQALYTVVGGGGGGGGLGPIGIAAGVSGTPTVGSTAVESECIVEARLGDKPVTTAMDTPLNTMFFAAGLTLTTSPVQNDTAVCSAYVVTLDSNGKYATVEEWGGTVTRREVELEGEAAWVWDFVMPELAEGEAIDLYLHT